MFKGLFLQVEKEDFGLKIQQKFDGLNVSKVRGLVGVRLTLLIGVSREIGVCVCVSLEGIFE